MKAVSQSILAASRVRTLLLAVGVFATAVSFQLWVGATAFGAPTQDSPAPPKAKESAPKDVVKPTVSAGQLKSALDRGANQLTRMQGEDGSYGLHIPERGYQGDVGVTALVVHALAVCPRKYREEDGPFVTKAIEYMLANVQPDGGIYEKGRGLENYKTSISILALSALDKGRTEKRYTKILTKAKEYVVSLQCSPQNGYDAEEHKRTFGGIGYGSDRRPDLSNTQFALEALNEMGLAEDSDVYKNAIKFLERCQNRAASNDTVGTDHKSTEDGGFAYAPRDTKALVVEGEDGAKSYSSYGSMTYAGIKSYIYAGLTADDPRVQAAYEWVCKNYTLTENPGMAIPGQPERGKQGLFYYYLMMARTLQVLGKDELVTADGVTHRWAEELAAKLISLQKDDGSWQNREDRWMEGIPSVASAYLVWALSICAEELK